MVLSPGPLVTLEEYIEYLKKIKKPYKLKNLVNFTNQNLHPFYKSLINQKKFDFVNIFEKNNLKIFNCFDLHISILRGSLCDSKIDFNTIDSDYLEKLKIKKSQIQYANNPDDLFVISFETIFSSRPSYHYHNYKYEEIDFYTLRYYELFKQNGLKSENFIKGTYILDFNLTKKKELIFKKHFKNLISINKLKSLYPFKMMSFKQIFHYFFKRILRKILFIYYKTPQNYRVPMYVVTKRSVFLTKTKIKILNYIYS